MHTCVIYLQMGEPGNQQGPPGGPPPGIHQGRVPPQGHRDMRSGWVGVQPGPGPFMGEYPPRPQRPGKSHCFLLWRGEEGPHLCSNTPDS